MMPRGLPGCDVIARVIACGHAPSPHPTPQRK